MSLSPSINWLLVRNNNAFLVKRNGKHFSSERGNLRNLHSARHSGLVNKHVVDISVSNGKPVLSLQSRQGKMRKRPAKAFRRVTLNKHFRKNSKTIKNELSNYRADLTSSALARYSQIARSLKAVDAKKNKKATEKKVVAKK